MRRTTYTLYNILILACVMLTAGAGTAWGQNGSVILENGIEPAHTINDVLYVIPGERTLVRFQDQNESLGMAGYIRWYVDEGNGTETIGRLNNNGNLTQYKNGYAFRSDGTRPSSAASIYCTFYNTDFNEQGISNSKLVYEASSVAAETRSSNMYPRAIGIRHVYEVRNAKERVDLLKVKQQALDGLGIQDQTDDLKELRDVPDASLYVLNAYDIYTPQGATANFRLPEELRNYYVPSTNESGMAQATQIRWKMNTSNDGKNWQIINNGNNGFNVLNNGAILKYKFPEGVTKACILAEVAAANSNDWYPVSFLSINLVKGYEPLTATKLNDKVNLSEYKHRDEEELNKNNALYQRIEHISFEKESEVLSASDETNLVKLLTGSSDNLKKNFTTTPFMTEAGKNAESYYAFAYPNLYTDRSNDELRLMKGEYALYRTLNYPGISRGRIAGLSNGNYNDYFPTVYNYRVTDRLWEKTANEAEKKSGYFMYVDAAETPGVITKIPINNLCPNTSLIVNAWVCDVSRGRQSDYNSRVPANIGFTLKGKDEKGVETILAKYYSGALSPEPRPSTNEDAGDGNRYAEWQQVSFMFSFSNTDISSEDEFILEISSNCEGSNGGDFGIDEISVYKTLPNISVRRKDACDASTLYVSSNYETILNNMGWEKGSDVLNVDELKNINIRKYRYGLMGNNPYEDNLDNIAQTNIGNVYFSFAYKGEEHDGSKEEDWVTINKSIEDDVHLTASGLHKTMRVIVPTNIGMEAGGEQLPSTNSDNWEDDVAHLEIVMNVRAMNDFIADTQRGLSGPVSDLKDSYWPDLKGNFPHTGSSDNLFEEFKTKVNDLCNRSDGIITRVYWEDIMNDTNDRGKTYTECLEAMYDFLEIPRIRCPWTDADGSNIYLSSIDVANTDLRYRGEKRPEETIPADGEYRVVLFSAREIASGTTGTISLTDPCTLISDFTVQPATTITIKTEASTSTATCAGSLRKVEAVLNGYDVDGNPIDDLAAKGVSYLFDWFLGSLEEYEQDASENGDIPLKTDLEAYRSSVGDKKMETITISDLEKWEGSGVPDAKRIKDRLIKLLTPDENDNVSLKTGQGGNHNYDLLITGDEIIAMPYVYSTSSDAENYVYCSDKTPVKFDVADADTPLMPTGFANVSYPSDKSASLRLGQLNLETDPNPQTSLRIPVRKDRITNMAGNAVGVESVTDVLLLTDAPELPVVGTVSDFKISQTTENATIPIKWNENAKKMMKEGQSYELLIPFVQFDSNNTVLSNACDGLVSFTVKIVPEYLTWNGKANGDKKASWYNDASWLRSTKGELYLDNGQGTSDEDAKDNTNVNAGAFSPLYFTKITVDPEKAQELELIKEEDIQNIDQKNMLKLDGQTSDDYNVNADICFDMAVNNTGVNKAIEVVPYYGNKVDQIYFKPNAKLKGQQHLTYKKAWVEFEMEKGAKYWLASPLQDVFAGDMYAPETTGRQTTQAFEDIKYTDATPGYDRWGPAFYQKAWDKGVTYYTDANGSASENVSVVHSNWSIEYNDVNVPYALGKGFYASVEDFENTENKALVRLPKSDDSYSYIPNTKALSTIANRPNAGILAGSEAIKITLIDSDDENTWGDNDNDNSVYYADGDGKHFLIGNPYMYPLDMEAFFDGNKNGDSDLFNRKYWTLVDGTISAVVGTPDVGFGDNTGAITSLGQIAPMQAFFVELVDSLTASGKKEIQFTTSMMADNASTSRSTKSYSATSPALTITAERGETKSVATLRTSDKADNGYNASEDAIVLLDSELDAPMAYTVAGSKAAQVNAVKSIRNIGLGVYNDKNDEVTLTIEGLSRLPETLYLYDAHTRKSVKLEGDSYSLQVSGDSHGRYFLRDSDLGTELENTISIYSAQRGKVIVSSLRPVKDIKVVTLNGSQVRRFSVNTTQYTFNLPAGIYMIYASDGEREHTEKVFVR